jgi:hypothetical protein
MQQQLLLLLDPKMLATEADEHSAAGSSSPLLLSGILQHVLSYVGPGHCLFVASISKWWRGIYATLESQQLTVHIRYSRNASTLTKIRIITCEPQMTPYSSVFASPSRVILAHETGLKCSSAAYQRAAGKYAGIETLAAAHSLGMQYTANTMMAAAQCNKLPEVQYLRSQGCPWCFRLLEDAAQSGHLELVR